MRLFPATTTADAKRVIIAKGLRAIGDGYVSLVLPAYLLSLGYSGFEIGALMTATLLGSALMTLLAETITARFGDRKPLLAASGLMIFTGLGFSGLQAFWPLLLVAFLGTLNPSAGDVSVFCRSNKACLRALRTTRPDIAVRILQRVRLVDGSARHAARVFYRFRPEMAGNQSARYDATAFSLVCRHRRHSGVRLS